MLLLSDHTIRCLTTAPWPALVHVQVSLGFGPSSPHEIPRDTRKANEHLPPSPPQERLTRRKFVFLRLSICSVPSQGRPPVKGRVEA